MSPRPSDWRSRCPRCLALASLALALAACALPDRQFISDSEFDQGGGGGGGSRENCTNGVDDDFDTKIDCADPDCSPAFTCVPELPAGWDGPIALSQAKAGAAPPRCDAAIGYQPVTKYEGGLKLNLNAGELGCPNCSCALDPKSAQCIGKVEYRRNSCTEVNSLPLEVGAACAPMPITTSQIGGPPTVAQLVSTYVKGAGSCQVTEIKGPNPQAPSFTDQARLCKAPLPAGGGCERAFACGAVPKPPFLEELCIVKVGEQACPLGFGDKHLTYSGLADQRSCQACSCSRTSPAALSCSGQIQEYSSAVSCTGPMAQLDLNVCERLTDGSGSGQFNRHAQLKATFKADCGAPSGGGVTGSLTAVVASTICCYAPGQ